MMTLDQRIEFDINERLRGKPLSEASKLSAVIKKMNSDESAKGFSTLGLPGYYCGDREAKTVIVNLNPGMDAQLADCMWGCKTLTFNHSSLDKFINDFHSYSKNYGYVDRGRYDSFDVKQAAFFYDWKYNGIGIPVKPYAGWGNKNFCLEAKEAVLMNKLQLELIPYASAKFTIDKSKIKLFFPYVETLVHEIFKEKRTYIVFASALFEDIFMAYNDDDIFNLCSFDLKSNEESCNLTKKDGKPMSKPLKCKQITLHYNDDGEERTAKALIAHSFPSQSIGRAFDIMQQYGAFCYNEYIKP